MGKALDPHQMFPYLTCYYSKPYAPPPHPMAPPSHSMAPPSPGSSCSAVEPLSRTNLYIRGLHPGTSDHDLVKLCQPYGKIVSTKAILDKNTNQCKGYGFVDFDCPAAAQKAVLSLKASGVQAQMAKQQEQDPTNLYLSNLPVSMDEQELEAALRPFGHVISTRVLRDASGVSRGVGFARMESTEKCEVVIQHFNGKYLKPPPGVPGPSEPLLCKFADGGQKKRQTQNKYTQNGRAWSEGETGMTLTYEPAVMQNGFYSSPYSITTNRMIAQASISPFITASPVSTYQVQSTAWMPQHQYVMQPTGSIISPGLDHSGVSAPPVTMMTPLTAQMNQLTLGSAANYITAPMQGSFIHQLTPVPRSALPVEGVLTEAPPQTPAPSSHDVHVTQQQITVETSDLIQPCSYQSNVVKS
ncbi:RNA-binding motif, single-stranded-interacting protein 3-like isoform X2 [Pimephales promelas]|uniref:RNA-binding motif, single-stranded-interacting protein 3-like isoform X2 n=1 Tax=Pimephales promelas TaxID=90988 RepID=UPI001955BCC1|nr:RNA-binding motif, single-stranded-interacting protein 3-like isoform X2 [Pimephales promelas]XP_039521865.1 RNA-binding motif, single-stranded-interacting protein 3-like isoform X2 [Pimephales promelas]XP_039521866.1 RNA-binding motif, single-stranded-interacting protein 3-like isoform X2 [Pimephales promelas]